LRLDGEGSLLWDKKIGGKEHESATGIAAQADGRLAIAGRTSSNSTEVNDLWFVMMQLSQMSLARQK